MLAATGLHAAVVLDVPREISSFDAPPIRVSGLPPLHPIAIRATMADATGAQFTSKTSFMPHKDGIVDTTRSIANGSYEGVDPMGVLWSMQGKVAFEPPVSQPMECTIDVLDENDHPLASAKILRRVIPADVRVTELRKPGSPIVGRFYEHPGGKRAAILSITGSNGGIDPRMAPYLATHGYNVLAIAVYQFAGTPDDLLEFPLEYFQSAIQWLARQPSVDGTRIGIVGMSKGAEAALLTASHFPDLPRAVGAFVPTHVVWEGVDARARFGGDPHFDSPGRSSWSLNGRPLPFVRKQVSPERLANRPRAFLDMYEHVVSGPVDPAARIPIERYRGPLFLAAAGDDIIWPSAAMAREIAKTRKVELHEYALAGHGIAPPGLPVTAGGGTRGGTAAASADAWPRLIKFLDANLAAPRTARSAGQ